MRGTCGDSGGGGREECVGEAMDGEELRRREVAAVIWKGGGGGCDLEGRRSGVRGLGFVARWVCSFFVCFLG